MTDVGALQLPVDLLAEDAANSAAVGDGLRRYWLVRNARLEQRLDKAVGGGLGVSKESLDLVSGEQTRVQANEGDPFGPVAGLSQEASAVFPVPSGEETSSVPWVGRQRPVGLEKGHHDSHGVPQGGGTMVQRGAAFHRERAGRCQCIVQGPIPGPLYSQGSRSSPIPWSR